MFFSKRFFLAAVPSLVLAIAQQTPARAADPEQAPEAFIGRHYVQPNYLGVPTSAEAQRTPLMGLLHQAGIGQSLEDARIRVFGSVEGSYEYNFNNQKSYHKTIHLPSGPLHIDNVGDRINPGRSFDLYEFDKGYLNQFNLNVERSVDLSAHAWQLGGRVEFLYGSDARFTISNGFLNHQDAQLFTIGRFTRADNELAFDIPRLYFDLAIPVGNGLRLRVGRFTFFKTIDPEDRLFYTETFAYHLSFPYTLTGGTLLYPLTDSLTLEGGISRGWDQSFADNNGMIDGFGRVSWDVNPSSLLTLGFICGPELPHNKTDLTTVIDVTYAQTVTEQFSVLVDGLFGHGAPSPAVSAIYVGDHEPHEDVPADADDYFYSKGNVPHTNWYGLSVNGIYKLNDFLSFAARAEWFRDESGAVTKYRFAQVNSEGVKAPPNLGENLYGFTLGMTITPFPNDPLFSNLKLRPEVRYDYASTRFFDSYTRHDQTTVAIDAIITY